MIPIHAIHYVGGSGVVFAKCGRLWSSARNAKTTDDRDKVTCEQCLTVINSHSKCGNKCNIN